MTPPLVDEDADGIVVVLPLPGVPPQRSAEARLRRKPADVPVSRVAGSHRAAHDPPRKLCVDVPVTEPVEPAHDFLVAKTGIEPVWPTPPDSPRCTVPVGLVHMKNLGDIEGRRGVFVMALHITRVATGAGDFYGISATKDWGATLSGRWLAVGAVKSMELTAHSKTWWRLGSPTSNRDLLWDIVAHDKYFSIRSCSAAITQGGWLYAALPEVDHGHRRVLTWTQEGDPSEDTDMRWSLTLPGPDAAIEVGRSKNESRSISIADVNRWKGISDPKDLAKAEGPKSAPATPRARGPKLMPPQPCANSGDSHVPPSAHD